MLKSGIYWCKNKSNKRPLLVLVYTLHSFLGKTSVFLKFNDLHNLLMITGLLYILKKHKIKQNAMQFDLGLLISLFRLHLRFAVSLSFSLVKDCVAEF